MYLKSLEVHGFKSFANKLVFEFHNGITGIVGPNGSGKSNVADAVRWVLGEQSAGKLRGASMQDVIFAGTQTRKPLGSAYVAITFSNEDHKLPVPYEEVKVARRVYRSGESEYLLNGTVCRLRDIQEMLFDTGIGKEGYSIIGQGQIDRILSVRSEERRELFDEAAGIVKYKKRKAATEKNLAEEEQNMARAGDILQELERQAGPVNEEAEKARKYLSLKDNLKKVDVNVFLFEYDEKKNKVAEIEKNEAVAESDREEKNKSLNEITEKAAALEDEISENERKRSELSGTQSELSLSVNNSENQIRILNEQIKNARDNEEHFNERREEFEKAGEKAEKELEKYKEARENALKDETDSRNRREELNRRIHEKRLSIRESDKKIEDAERNRIDFINASAKDRAEKQKYETLLEQNSIQKARTAQRLLKNKTSEDELLNKLSEEKEEAEDITDKLEALSALDKTITEGINEIKVKLLSAEKNHNDIQAEYHMQNSRLLSVRNMAERYDGFGQSIRRVMEQKKNHPGIVGVVADVIGAPEKYETAIETALGGQIQNIVTDSQQTAKAMINFLKKNRFGRATFLPLDTITPGRSSITPEVLREKGAIGTASDLAVYEERFERLARFLLGRVLVVDNIDNAIAIGNKFRHTLRMVTLEGDILNPGGSMSGGTYRNSSNLLGRRREIEDLEKKVDDLKSRLAACVKESEEIRKTLSREQDKIAGNSKLRNDLNIQLNSHRINCRRTEEDIEKLHSERDSINSDKSLLEASGSDIKKKIEEIDLRFKESGYSDEDYERIRAQLGDKKKELQKELTSLMDEGTAVDMQITTSTNNAAFAAENIQRAEEALKAAKNSLETLIKENNDFGSVLESKNSEILKEKESIEVYREKLLQLEEKIKEASSEEKALKEKSRKAISEKEELIRNIAGLERESDRLSSMKEKLEGEISSYIDYMWEEYEITYNDALVLRESGDNSLKDMSYRDMKKSISDLRQQIKALGNVNVNSIEKSREINERYSVLSTQYDDIVKAKESLEKIIADLDQKMREIFTQQFEKINESFNIVFREMFGGGHGSISLDDADDVLSSGVTIVAQPPGKKLQNMMQMSGGEKALTAISLLFAIQRLKPSPFCLLDEIEAALDDSNVARFAEYLHKLTADTQFIVITHRRGTMNAADRLYGITMQEKGVSTLISVDLVEADKLIQDEEKEK